MKNEQNNLTNNDGQLPENDCVVDFSIFKDLSRFEHFIDLKDATVEDCVKSYIQNRVKNKEAAKRSYAFVLGHIRGLQDEFGFVLMPLVVGDLFWNKFHQYLKNKNLANGTINNICAKICAVLKWAAKYGAKISPTIDDCYCEANLARPRIALTLDEISRITYFDIEAALERKCRKENLRPHRCNYIETLKRVRDEFVLSCYIGQRYSDARRVNPDNFNGDVFSIVQKKTGNRAVVDFKEMCLYPKVVRDLLEKYNYNAPYSGDIANYNRKLHELFELAGFDEEINFEYKENGKIKKKVFKKYQLISSHTARRSMITNNIQRNINRERVRRASGHKSDSAFNNYVVWNND